MWKRVSEYFGDAYPGEEPEVEAHRLTPREDYTNAPGRANEVYQWVASPNGVLIHPDKSHKELFQLGGYRPDGMPHAQGTMEVHYNWEVLWTLESGNMNIGTLEKALKKDTKERGWKYEGIVNKDGKELAGTKKQGMADRTDNPAIDALIEEYLGTPMGDWTTSDSFNEALRDPAEAAGACQAVAEDFAEFAKGRGWSVAVTHTDLDEMGYTPSIDPQGEIMDDEGNIVPGFYHDHTVNEIYELPDGTKVRPPIVVDWTATQYGYTDLPKISGQLNPIEGWQYADNRRVGFGMRGDLPEGIEFQWADHPWGNRDDFAVLYARIGHETIGRLAVRRNAHFGPPAEPGQESLLERDVPLDAWYISGVKVPEKYRRMGIATALLDRAREDLGYIYHSGHKTDMGEEWSKRTTSRQASVPGINPQQIPEGMWRTTDGDESWGQDVKQVDYYGISDAQDYGVCPECDQPFDSYSTWRRHFQDEHGQQPQTDDTSDAIFPANQVQITPPHKMQIQGSVKLSRSTMYTVVKPKALLSVAKNGLMANPPQKNYPWAKPGVYLWNLKGAAEEWKGMFGGIVIPVDVSDLPLKLDQHWKGDNFLGTGTHAAFVYPGDIPPDRVHIPDEWIDISERYTPKAAMQSEQWQRERDE